MTEYTTLRNTDLQKLLADRNLSVTGSKVTMIERLQDDDAAKKRSLFYETRMAQQRTFAGQFIMRTLTNAGSSLERRDLV